MLKFEIYLCIFAALVCFAVGYTFNEYSACKESIVSFRTPECPSRTFLDIVVDDHGEKFIVCRCSIPQKLILASKE